MYCFKMHNLNGALFLNATLFSDLLFSFATTAKRSIVASSNIKPHKGDINIEVLKP